MKPLSSFTDRQPAEDSQADASLYLQVRAVEPQDLSDVAEILCDSFHSKEGTFGWAYPLLRLGIYEDLRSRLQNSAPHHVCLVATYGSARVNDLANSYICSPPTLAGTVEMAVRPTTGLWGGNKYPYLSNLAVHPRDRRRGIGEQLLLTCERTAREWGFHDIYLHVLENNYQARQLYFKLGYHLHQIDAGWSSWLWGRPRQILLHKYLK